MHVRLDETDGDGDAEAGVATPSSHSGTPARTKRSKHGSFAALPDTPGGGDVKGTFFAAGRRRSSAPVPVVLTRRWAMLTLFSLVTMSNACAWISFASIADIVQDWYDVSAFAVNSLSMVFMVAYVPFVFVGSWVLDTYGLRTCVALGAFLSCLGQWIRFIGSPEDGFMLLWIGQAVAAIAQAFILGVPARLSAVWFGAKEKNTATALGVMANQMGTALGFLLPALVVHKGADIKLLLVYEGIGAGVGFVGVLLFFANEPPVPPSFAAITSATPGNSRSYRSQLAALASDWNFLALIMAYGANVGMYYGFATFINQFLLPHFPGQDTAIGWVGGSLVLAGIVGDVAVGYALDKTHAYKTGFLICNGLCIASYVGFLFSATAESMPLVFVTGCCMGATGTSVLVLGLEYAAQITFPIPEATSSGLMNLAAQVWGSALVGSLTFVETDLENGVAITQYVLIGVLVAAEILVFPVRSSLKRLETEKSMREQSESRLRGARSSITSPKTRLKSADPRTGLLVTASTVGLGAGPRGSVEVDSASVPGVRGQTRFGSMDGDDRL